MTWTNDRFINLFTDFGFKKIFGEEPNKDLLIAFLNDLLEGKEQIAELSYLKNERLGRVSGERKAVYDLYCTNQSGEKFIVEIQRAKQEFFKDRTLYYSSFAIQEQAETGKDWRYQLKAVYTIAIMDFEFSDKKNKVQHRIKLMDEDDKDVFYEKLTFIYLEVPKFNKTLAELQNNYERWLFAFRNLHRLQEMPEELQNGVFKKLFEQAEIAKMKPQERKVYEESLKDYRDLRSSITTSYNEGKEEGREEGREEGIKQGLQQGFELGEQKAKAQTVVNAWNSGLSAELIANITGLSHSEIKEILQANGIDTHI